MPSRIRIALLGATSHIAKGLIVNFVRSGYPLTLFARSVENVRSFLRNNCAEHDCIISDFEGFSSGTYDVIINCVGIADSVKQKAAGAEIFFLTEKFDNLILGYLYEHPEALYINFSSGAVYGTAFSEPVRLDSASEVCVNRITSSDYYRIAKMNAEAKHRACGGRIIDLRVFSYFSRYVDMSANFLMTEIINCVKNDKPFVTSASDIVRDYVSPEDLFNLVLKSIDALAVNTVYDVFSVSN